jgi:ATP-dependent RNA/DNA helicase IGHMBP2
MSFIHIEPLPARTTKSDIVRFVCDTGDIDRRRLGRIDLSGRHAAVEVPDGWETRVVKALDGAAFGDGRVRAWTGGERSAGASPSSDDFFRRLTRLMDLEAQAEAQQTADRIQRLSGSDAEHSGESLVDLVVQDEFSALGGRFVARFVKRNRTLSLPWSRLGVGTPVIVSPEDGSAGSGVRGVVSERSDRFIDVAINEPVGDAGDRATWRLDRSVDEVARMRQRTAMDRAGSARGDRLAELRQVLLGERPPQPAGTAEFTALDRSLNESQCNAVQFALASPDLALMHGPPGTGKTTAVVELIRQAVRRGEKVLACAPSNLAVDNMLERLLAERERAVRLGHPARVLPQLRDHTLDQLVESHGDVQMARKLVREAIALFRKAKKFTRARPEPGARHQMRDEAKELLADARRLESQAIESILNSADVLCATTTGLDSEILGQRFFDLIVIDEACQSTEPGCWVPVLRGRRLVLAGDHCQLPPTVVSAEAAREGFAVSMFERLMQLHGPSVARRLRVQYRMHESIMRFSSDEFYDGDLVPHESVRGHLLRDIPGVTACPITETPVVFIDTAGAGFDEEVEPDGESRFNRSEAELILRKVGELLAAGVTAESIAIIAPYAAQVRLLRQTLGEPGVEIDTVDGFQGREKEAVLISLVRSNPQGEIGFLADVRRMNVAMTRARRLLLIVGDTATLSGDPFYARLFGHLEATGAYRTVWEEPV